MGVEKGVKELIEARGMYLKAASERRDVEEVVSWMSKDIVYENAVQGTSVTGLEAVKKVYRDFYEMVPHFKIVKSNVTSVTPEFMVLEIVVECKVKDDMPTCTLGFTGGEEFEMRGVTLMWWKWEGEGESWDGTLSEDQVRGWKIAREHVYAVPIKKDGAGKNENM